MEQFECLVCTRVAKNMEMSQIGFGKMPYQANSDHYGCPAPDVENSGTLSNAQNRWWERQWKQAFYESQVINDLIEEKIIVNSKKEFYDHVLELIKADTEKLLKS